MILVDENTLEELVRAWTSAREALIQEYSKDFHADYEDLGQEEDELRRRLILGRYDPDWGVVPNKEEK